MDEARKQNARDAFTAAFNTLNKFATSCYISETDARVLTKNFVVAASSWLAAEERIYGLTKHAPPSIQEVYASKKFELPAFLKGLPSYDAGVCGAKHEILQIEEYKRARERDALKITKAPLPSLAPSEIMN